MISPPTIVAKNLTQSGCPIEDALTSAIFSFPTNFRVEARPHRATMLDGASKIYSKSDPRMPLTPRRRPSKRELLEAVRDKTFDTNQLEVKLLRLCDKLAKR